MGKPTGNPARPQLQAAIRSIRPKISQEAFSVDLGTPEDPVQPDLMTSLICSGRFQVSPARMQQIADKIRSLDVDKQFSDETFPDVASLFSDKKLPDVIKLFVDSAYAYGESRRRRPRRGAAVALPVPEESVPKPPWYTRIINSTNHAYFDVSNLQEYGKTVEFNKHSRVLYDIVTHPVLEGLLLRSLGTAHVPARHKDTFFIVEWHLMLVFPDRDDFIAVNLADPNKSYKDLKAGYIPIDGFVFSPAFSSIDGVGNPDIAKTVISIHTETPLPAVLPPPAVTPPLPVIPA